MVKIAVGQMDITPDEPAYLCGYSMREGKSTGVLDRILVTAITLAIGSDKICMLSYDLVALDKELSDEIRNSIAQKYGIAYDKILASFTHTHSAPEVMTRAHFNKEERVSPGYRQFLVAQSLNAMEQACVNGFQDVNVYMVKGEIEGYYSNRNNIDGHADKSVNILKFVNTEGKVVSCLVNMTCHSTVLGPASTDISGDLFGYIRNGLQKNWDTTILMANGAAGDMSNRQYRQKRQGSESEELKRIGEGVLEQILNFTEEPPINMGDKITVIKNFYHLDYMQDKEEVGRTLSEIEEKLKTETNPDQIRLFQTVVSAGPRIMGKDRVDVLIDSYTYQLGDVTMVTIPGEMFSKFALEIKAASPAPYTILWGYNNQLLGYFVEEDEYGKYFESFISDIPKGLPEELTSIIIDNMNGK